MEMPKKGRKAFEEFTERWKQEAEQCEKEDLERKRKKWEAFWELPPERKIDQLWTQIYYLEEKLENHMNGEMEWSTEFENEVFKRFKAVDKRFRSIYDCLESLGATYDYLASLALLMSSGPTNYRCPDCRRFRVFRKISSTSPIEKYILECKFCGWREEEEFFTDD
jgi:hypothetical protein